MAHVFEHQCKGVEFVAGAGRGAPDAEFGCALGAAGGEEGGEDFFAEVLELGFVAEKEGFVDGDFIDQEAIFGAATGAFEVFEIIIKPF